MSTYNPPQAEKTIKLTLSPITLQRGEVITLFADRAEDARRNAIQIELIVTHSGQIILAASESLEVTDFETAALLIKEAADGDS